MIGGARVLVPEGFQRSRDDLEPHSRSYSVWSLSNMSQDVSWGRWQLLTLVSFPCKLTSVSPQWGIFHAPGYHSGWSDHNDNTTSKGQTTWPGFRLSGPRFCSIFTVSSPVRFFPFDELIQFFRNNPCAHNGPCTKASNCPCHSNQAHCVRSCRCSSKCQSTYSNILELHSMSFCRYPPMARLSVCEYGGVRNG